MVWLGTGVFVFLIIVLVILMIVIAVRGIGYAFEVGHIDYHAKSSDTG